MTELLPHVHEFAALNSGRCHYRIDGPVQGKILFLIHGATVPGWQFDRLVPRLNAAGFRTLRFDLYGHGYSDRPATAHNYALFTRQATELLDYLALGNDIHVLGHSLGAAIAARLVLATPDRFASLVLTAPMLNFMALNPAMRALQVPLLGELLMKSYVLPMLVRRRTRRYRNIGDGRYVQRFRDQLRLPGFGRSLLSLIRSDALADQQNWYRALSALGIPLLVISGSVDRISIPAHINMLREVLPAAQWHDIADAEHAMIFTHPDLIAARITRFVNRLS